MANIIIAVYVILACRILLSDCKDKRLSHRLQVFRGKITKKESLRIGIQKLSLKKGGYLLSHFVGSTIGVGGLNFSVRNGKRWNTAAIAT